MIFYIATDEAGRRHLCGTQADARVINRNFEQVDVPVTPKEALRDYVQALLAEVDQRSDATRLLRELDEKLIDDGGYPRFTVAHGGDFDAIASRVRTWLHGEDTPQENSRVVDRGQDMSRTQPIVPEPVTWEEIEEAFPGAMAEKFEPEVLERQIELLAENPEAGFDAIEQHQQFTGVGAAFSRGVHILNIIAAGQHQLARMLRKARK